MEENPLSGEKWERIAAELALFPWIRHPSTSAAYDATIESSICSFALSKAKKKQKCFQTENSFIMSSFVHMKHVICASLTTPTQSTFLVLFASLPLGWATTRGRLPSVQARMGLER